jgi:isopropylmalate/homocitrate/citramalate synthase
MGQPWKTDEYFVSHLNYMPQVTKDYALPPRVKIHDVTLRDGEQQTGVELRRDDKIRIAEKLAETGIHRIEAGMPAVSRQDEAAIREIVKRNLGPEIFGFCRCVVEDVRLAADCGVSGVVIEIPSSEHIIQKAYKWPLAKAVDLSVKATRLAHELGLYVVFFTIDATRADPNWLKEIILQVAREGHMDALAIVDTMGAASVSAARYYVRQVKSFINTPLEAHFHNDFGLAIANSLAAVEEGAEVVHTTVLGMGERAGQAATEQMAMALKLLYGLDTGIRLDRLNELCSVVAQVTGHVVPENQPVVGKRLFQIESGIPATWWMGVDPGDRTEVMPYLPSLVGRPDVEIVLGKKSGVGSIEHHLRAMGMNASPEQMVAITVAVKEEAMKKRGLLTTEDLKTLATGLLQEKGG